LTVEGHFEAETATFNELVEFNENVNFLDSVLFDSEITVLGHSSLNTIDAFEMETTGDVLIGGNLTVEGNTTLEGTVGFKGQVTFDSDVTFKAKILSDDTTESLSINTGAIITKGGIGVTKSANIGGELTVTDEAEFKSFVNFSTDDGIKIPTGFTTQRPTGANLLQGTIRYNITDSTFEGYDGANWGSLGGVKDTDQDTYISAENSPGVDNDQLKFFTGGTQRAILSDSDFNIAPNTVVQGDLTVHGTTVTLNTATVEVDDNLIVLNKNQPTPAADTGIIFQRYATPTAVNFNAGLFWDENIVASREYATFHQTGITVDYLKKANWQTTPETNTDNLQLVAVDQDGTLVDIELFDGGTY
jgi:hypothetical protein